ncbi:MAG TPA: hypothetical protein PLW02_09075, partial [Verrucomicrobiota bacterium]|nr:hypothetical protein [Verrucomicrobiota bacterium]
MKKIIVLVAFSILIMSGKSIASALDEKAVNSRVVQREDICANNLIVKMGAQKRGYVELSNGARYLNAQRIYEDTKEEFAPVSGGAVCLTGPHKVKLSANINDYGAIELCTPDGLRLKSHLSCIAYANDRKTVVIAKVKDSIGKLIAPNQILYEDCFDGRAVKGSLRYTYTREGFEQDVLFDQLPDADSFNLGDNVSIQVITEFIEPPKEIGFTKSVDNANQDVVNLGTMQFAPGKAFALKEIVSQQNAAQLPSRKSDGVSTQHKWVKQNVRVFLVESISYNKIKSMFDCIKPQVQAAPTVVQQSEEINYPEIPKQSNNNRAIELAQSNTELGPAVVIDYVILNTITNFVFAGDTTYYLSGDVIISGLVTFEGGAVIKYDRGASLTITGGIEDRTSTYLPITFTAKDDDSIGEIIKGSTGKPQNYYAATALNLHNYQSDLRNLRIFYADQAILYSGITNVPTFVDSIMYYSLQIWNSQFINCGHGIVSEGGSITLRNILMYNVRTNFQNSLNKVNIGVEHLTVNQSDKLIDGNDITLNITNSLIVNAADSSGITESNVVVVVNGNDIFLTVGAAGHYLADNSPYRNIGSTNIHARLKDEFRLRTTFPPKVVSSMKIEKTTEFSSQVERDNDIPDLGYHY